MIFNLLIICMLFISCSNNGENGSKMGGMVNTKAAKTRENSPQKICIKGDGYPLTVVDYFNNEIVLEKKPDTFAVTSGTFLNMWYALGGRSICTTELNSAYLDPRYAEEMMALPLVGQVYNPNLESVVELQPEYTIGQVGTQSSMIKKLNEMGMKASALHMRTYDDVLDHIRAFGKLLENEAAAESIISKMEQEKQKIVEEIPKDDITVVVLYVTSRSLSIKLDNSIAGNVAKILKLDNIASNLPPDTIGSETTPLDIEYLVEQNPDFVLVTSMITSNEEAQKVMEEEFSKNAAWKSVEAVREKRVVYLPQEYFLYNAGHRFVEAIRYMAENIYPELFSEKDE